MPDSNTFAQMLDKVASQRRTGENQSPIFQILRVFDDAAQFGVLLLSVNFKGKFELSERLIINYL